MASFDSDIFDIPELDSGIPVLLQGMRAQEPVKPLAKGRFRMAIITSFNVDQDPGGLFDPKKYGYINYQKEVCPTTGKEHWQIFIEKKGSQGYLSLKGLKDLFGDTCHVKFVERDNGASRYCLKDETSVDGTRREIVSPSDEKLINGVKRDAPGPKKGHGMDLTFESIRSCATWDEVLSIPKVQYCMTWARDVFLRKPIDIPLPDGFVEYRPWQNEEFELIQRQNDRQIRYIVDFKGGAGKSVFAKRMVTELGAFYCNGGKKSDIIHAYEGQEYVCFDLSRSMDQQYWPYQVMEELKNGLSFSGKYCSVTKRFKPCKIVVLTNEEPDMSKHSMDRWSIRYLSDKPVIFNSEAAYAPVKRAKN